QTPVLLQPHGYHYKVKLMHYGLLLVQEMVFKQSLQL
ncbi:hypothetical protein TVAGG3_0067870, partial [Trichomonas vaginalis G3]